MSWLWDEFIEPLRKGLERPRLVGVFQEIPWYCWLIAGLLVLIVVIVEHSLKLIHDAEHEAESLRNPEFRFVIGHEATPQILSNGGTGIHRRISVKNDSDATAINCKMVVNSCSVNMFDFTRDSALQVKDNNGRAVDINPRATEMFDLAVTFLHFATKEPDESHICTSTWPELPKAEQDVTLNLSLTGRSFLPRHYVATLRCGAGNAEIVDIHERS